MEILRKLLEGASADITGVAFDLAKPVVDHTVQIQFNDNGGTVTALTLILRGSIDDVNYPPMLNYSLTAPELAEKFKKLYIPNKKERYVQAQIIVTHTGNAPSIDVNHL